MEIRAQRRKRSLAAIFVQNFNRALAPDSLNIEMQKRCKKIKTIVPVVQTTAVLNVGRWLVSTCFSATGGGVCSPAGHHPGYFFLSVVVVCCLWKPAYLCHMTPVPGGGAVTSADVVLTANICLCVCFQADQQYASSVADNLKRL